MLKIAVITNQVEGTFQTPLCHGLTLAAQERECVLYFFPVRELEPHNENDQQHNFLLPLSNSNLFNGFIFTSGSLSNYIGREKLLSYIKSYLNKPVVSIHIPFKETSNITMNNKSGLSELMDHLIEFHGYKSFAFLSGPELNPEAEERFSVFLNALDSHGLTFDWDLFYRGNFHPMAGSAGVKELIDVRKVSFECLVCANDDMAATAIKALKERNYSIPQDIAVTGYDDIPEMKYLHPGVTTVSQPLHEIGWKALHGLMDMIQGKSSAKDITVDSVFIKRQSCGCQTGQNKEKMRDKVTKKGVNKEELLEKCLDIFPLSGSRKKKIHKILLYIIENGETLLSQPDFQPDYHRITSFFEAERIEPHEELDHWKIALSLILQYFMEILEDSSLLKGLDLFLLQLQGYMAELILKSELLHRNEEENHAIKLRDFLSRLNRTGKKSDIFALGEQEFSGLGVHWWHVVLYKEQIEYGFNERGRIPPQAQLVFGKTRDNLIPYDSTGRLIDTASILPLEITDQGEPRSLIIMPLFNKTFHYGYIVFEWGAEDSKIYETLRDQISSALNKVKNEEERNQAELNLKILLKELERTNRELQNISELDELTGLYNRRGFIISGEELHNRALNAHGSYILFYIDLDRLKVINDSFGHESGDLAIRGAALILKKTFRDSDIVCRIGGDEFTVIVPQANESRCEQLKTRLARCLEDFNKEKDFPFNISLSMGYAVYDGISCKSFQEMIKEADDRQYESKMLKRNKLPQDFILKNKAQKKGQEK